jgi:molybdopterin-containing oxidoreductase family iron-sulfur binding subunit
MPPVDTYDVPVSALAREGVTRREFMTLAAASAALAGCAQRPARTIYPYNDPPPEVTPGVAQHFATAMVVDGLATGLLVTSHEGRPTKIEGNPQHPMSLGATNAQQQAAVLSLYDPQRARGLTGERAPREWRELVDAVAAKVPKGGAGLRFLMDPTSSPLEIGLIAKIRAALPEAGFTFHAAAVGRGELDGARAALGRPLVAHHDLTRADVVLSLGADFTASGPMSLRHARAFSDRRRRFQHGGDMNRLWMVESSLSPTGSVADHRLRVRPSEMYAVAAAVLAGVRPGSVPVPPGPASPEWVRALVADLTRVRGRAAVLVGADQPAEVHALGRLLDEALGTPVTYRESPIFEAGGPSHDLAPLVRDLERGAVKLLVLLGWNPVYQAPADLDLAAALERVETSIYLGGHRDETAPHVTWFVPALHFLESWGDACAADGTVSFVQPLVEPLFGAGKCPADLLALFTPAATGDTDVHDLLAASWAGKIPWERSLALGFVDGSALPAVAPAVDWSAARARPAAAAAGVHDIAIVPDFKVHDGRFANSAWLQELPAPMTKLTWDNAAIVSPRTARELGAATGDRVELELDGRKLRAPAFVLPGQADATITLAMGYGRAGEEAVARGRGVDAGALRTSAAPFGGRGVARRVAGHDALSVTQEHGSALGRPIALRARIDEYRRVGGRVTEEQSGPLPSLLRDHYTQEAEAQWAMSVDMTVCTGCSACVVACQAENNIPVVGKDGVRRSREMHWLRVDRYFFGAADDPAIVNQPMMCQHCEKAPCEYVCPVNATVHSPDGLNEMVYNRCIGTRFCSNNCPYKVRRFNFFSYVDRSMTMLQKNPNVTVRQRGVMEKCTYCVQRIRAVEIEARLAGRPLGGNDVVTACQQACPTRAIVFGSLHDPAADVTQLQNEARAYEVLHELGTRPRTGYLVKLENPSPELERE